MRAIFWKELRELGIAAIVVAVLGVLVGLAPKSSSLFGMGVLPLHGGLGVLVGAWQAFLDRRATGDAFLLHRPLAAWRLHAARAAAGLAVVLVVSLASLAVTLYVPWRRALETFGPLRDPKPFPRWIDFTPGIAAFAVAFAAATWAATRFGASQAGVVPALFLGAFMPSLLAMSLAATTTDGAAVALVLLSGALATTLLVARQSAGFAAGSSR